MINSVSVAGGARLLVAPHVDEDGLLRLLLLLLFLLLLVVVVVVFDLFDDLAGLDLLGHDGGRSGRVYAGSGGGVEAVDGEVFHCAALDFLFFVYEPRT